MSQVKFVLLVCGIRNEQYHILLDMIDDKNQFPLYEITLTSDGFAQNVKILPRGTLHPFTEEIADYAIDDVQSLSIEDAGRIALNQLSQIDGIGWESLSNDCYQYVSADLDNILDMGVPDPFEDEVEMRVSQKIEHGMS
jgi:hypothetical protein